jgi:hypothetical protein
MVVNQERKKRQDGWNGRKWNAGYTKDDQKSREEGDEGVSCGEETVVKFPDRDHDREL